MQNEYTLTEYDYYLEKDAFFSKLPLYVLLPIFCIIGFFFSTSGNIAKIGIALSAFLFLFTIFSPVRFIPFFLIIMLLGPDITQGASEALEVGRETVGSPWQIGYKLLSPGMIQACLYTLVIIRLGHLKTPPSLKYFLAYTFAIGILGFLMGKIVIRGFGVPLAIVFSDVRMVLFLTLSCCVFLGYSRHFPEKMYQLCQILFLVLLARLSIDAINWIAGTGAYLSGVSRGGVDSTKWTALVIFFWSLYNLVQSRNIAISGFLLAVSIIMTLVYMTRMNYLTLVLGAIIMLLVLKKGRFLFIGIPCFIILIIIVGVALQAFSPDAYRIYMIRFEQIYPIFHLDFQAADPFRYAEFVNCFGSMAKDGTLLFGRGFGGYYTDEIFPMGSELLDAFQPWSEMTRHFPRIHNIIGQFVLKFGLIGLSLWIVVWLRTFMKLFRLKIYQPHWETVRIVLLALIPTVFFSGYWSSKGIILTGLFLVISIFLTEEYSLNSNQYYHNNLHYQESIPFDANLYLEKDFLT